MTAPDPSLRDGPVGRKLLYSVREVADLLSVGRAKVYELLSAGKIESVKLDGSRRILRESLEEYIERLRGEAGLF